MRRVVAAIVRTSTRARGARRVIHVASSQASVHLHRPPTTYECASRSFSTNSEDDDLQMGRTALERALEHIENDDLGPAMKYLNIAAHLDIADAQYLLGTLLERDNEDDDKDDAVVVDAETKRQQLAEDAESEPQELTAIRKRARRAYKEYLISKSVTTNGHQKDPRTDQLVQRASKEVLDRVFGVKLKELLNPQSTLRPLALVAQEEQKNAALGVDTTQAIEWFRRAAANGHRDAHVYLGNICLEQDPPLVEHALEWYFCVVPPKMEKNPHPDALFNIGTLLYEGAEDANPPFPRNPIAAIPYFVLAAQEGDASAQFFMGQMLYHGDPAHGIAPNTEAGLILIQQAVENDHAGATFFLAQLYRTGDEESGITMDREKFLEYLDKAIEGGDEEAMYCQADIYYHGSDGFERDLVSAQAYYLAAAEQGSADAYCCLGAIYYNGEGVEQDYEKAFQFYQEAADRHSMEAWKNLADMYYNGHGVPKNIATADSIVKMLQQMEQEDDSKENE